MKNKLNSFIGQGKQYYSNYVKGIRRNKTVRRAGRYVRDLGYGADFLAGYRSGRTSYSNRFNNMGTSLPVVKTTSGVMLIGKALGLSVSAIHRAVQVGKNTLFIAGQYLKNFNFKSGVHKIGNAVVRLVRGTWNGVKGLILKIDQAYVRMADKMTAPIKPGILPRSKAKQQYLQGRRDAKVRARATRMELATAGLATYGISSIASAIDNSDSKKGN